MSLTFRRTTTPSHRGMRAVPRAQRGIRLVLAIGWLLGAGLGGSVLAAGCSRETEERPSMPEERKVLLDSMPKGVPEDSMAAQMERAFRGDTAR